MKRAMTATLLICTLLLCSCTEYKLQGQVDATVTSKKYESSYTTMLSVWNGTTMTMIPQAHPEEHNVELKYNNCITTADDEELYKKVQINDKIKVNHYISEDRKYERILYQP